MMRMLHTNSVQDAAWAEEKGIWRSSSFSKADNLSPSYIVGVYRLKAISTGKLGKATNYNKRPLERSLILGNFLLFLFIWSLRLMSLTRTPDHRFYLVLSQEQFLLGLFIYLFIIV